MAKKTTEITNLDIQLPVGDQSFKLSLCQKSLRLASDLTLRQFWMNKQFLFNPSGPGGGNFAAIINAFWCECDQFGLRSEPDNQQVYLQAQLLPFIRSIGSGRILWDASFSKHNDPTPRIEELETRLRSPEKRVNDSKDPRVRFRDMTANALGLPGETTAEVQTCYWEFERQLFENVAEILESDPVAAFALVKQRWKKWMNGIARRGNKKAQRLALDYISYECKAAFYRCYSLVWWLLIEQLVEQVELTPVEAKFHRFWHLQRIEHSNHREASFACFHGHVFGLHPALSDLIQTPTGQRLLAQYLRAAGEEHDQPETVKLMHGVALAAWNYSQAAEESRQSRQGSQKRAAGAREELIYEKAARQAYGKEQDDLIRKLDSH